MTLAGHSSDRFIAKTGAASFLGGSLFRFYVFVALVHFFLWLPVWIIYFQQRGMTLTQIGVLDAVGWVMAAAEVPTGGLADRYGRKWALAAGAVLVGASMLAITTEVLSPIFLIGWMLWGIAHTFFSGADAAFLYDSLKADGRAADYPKFAGWHFAVMQASQSVASLAGGWVASFDMTLCFVIPGMLALLASGVAVTLREPTRSRQLGQRGRYWAEMAQAARIASGRPVVRYLVLIGASTLVFPFLLVFMLLQPYATELGVSVSALGAIVFVRGAAAVGGSTLSSRVSAAIGTGPVLIGTQGVVVLCMAMLALAPSQPILVLFVVMSFANGLMRPVLSALLNDEIPSEQRATIISLQALLWTVFLAAVEPALFALGERTGLPFGIGLSAVVLAIVAAVLLALWRRAALGSAGPVIVAA